METCEVEVWLVVDAPGDYGVGRTEEQALENYEDNIGGNSPRRVVKLTLTVPLPRVQEVRAALPAPPEPPDAAVRVEAA